MKLLQISNYYYPNIGGIEQVAKDISKSLIDDSNIEQKIICFNENVSRDKYSNKRNETIIEFVDGVEVTRCGCFTKIFSQSLSSTYYNKLKKMINEYNPDVIIFHYPNPFVASFLLSLIKKDTKLILYWHLDIVKQKILGKVFHRQNISLLERANTIVATSPNYIDGSKYLSKYKDKCIVIPNCVSINYEDISKESIEKAKEIRNKYKDKFICFTVGRHIPYKGFEYLIKASEYLGDDCIVLIGGRGPLTEKLKEQSKGNSKVELIGFISDNDLIAYYLACDVITFSSITKNEAFGISLAEGMAFGKPAITFTIPGSGVNYVNLNNITGIECPNRDCKVYADAIMKLKGTNSIRTKFGKEAQKRIINLFSFKNFKQNIYKLINSIV